MKTSKFFTWNFKDIVKGLIVATLGAAIGLIDATIKAGNLNFDWPAIGKAALTTALAYLLKNLLTNSKDQFATKEPG